MILRKLLILVLIISPLVHGKPSWGENYSFRYTRWGMTQEDVITSEEKMDPIEKTENMITYKTQILGKNVALHYLFVENKLVGAIYKLEDNYLNSQHFIQTYLRFKEVLVKKYGPPNRETTNWLNNTYRNVRKKWGLALSLGHVEYYSSWQTQNTTIECSLKELNYFVVCSIEYWSVENSHLLKQIEQEDRLDPL